MGRLFWKFFLFLWLAQLTSVAGVGVVIWLNTPLPAAGAPAVDVSPPARFQLSAAVATLRHGGIGALLDERSDEPGPPVFVIDEAQRDIRGRAISPEMLARIRPLASEPAGHSGAEEVLADDGRRYLLFVPPHPHPAAPGVGPEGGPGAAPEAGERSDRPPPPRRPFSPWLPFVVGALASLLFAAGLAWYFARPIRSLRLAFEAAASGRLEQRLAPEMGQRRDELADLGRDFDRMTQRLKDLLDGQRRLLHDVSHELRSPLARLQAAIGLLRQQPERSHDLLSRIERESVRMDHLVDELLTLSRVEAGMAGSLGESVELGELLRGVVEDACFEAEARNCQTQFSASRQAYVSGSSELLHRALENIVRNAVKHSPDGATIGVDLVSDDARQMAVIRVSDRGAGVPEADLASIFEPFFRGQSAHSADSHGLGLAIAQRVAAAHGGQIAAQNCVADGVVSGFVVTVSLPLLAAG